MKKNKKIITLIFAIIFVVLFFNLGRNLQNKGSVLANTGVNNKINFFQAVNPYDFSKPQRVMMQTHSHSSLGSGSDTPQQLIENYQALNFGALAITDHDSLTWPWPISPPSMVAVEGNELTSSWHMTSLFNNYLRGGETNPQVWVNEINSRDGISIVNHPNRYSISCSALEGVTGYTGIEIYNYRSSGSVHYSLDLWDCLLNSGRKNVWGFASDDYHGGAANIDRGKIIVLADDLTEQGIKTSLKSGNFYSAVGTGLPLTFQNISVSNSTLNVTINIASNIKFIGNNGVTLKSVSNQSTTSYNILGNENYVRIEAQSGTNTIYSNPVAVNQLIYSWQIISQTSDRSLTNLIPDDIANVTLTAKNTGNVTWTNSGPNPVRIGTWPMERSSAFYVAGNWLGTSRPVTMNESSVAPGANATFSFQMKAPSQTGIYIEHFNLLAESLTWMVDTGLSYYCKVN